MKWTELEEFLLFIFFPKRWDKKYFTGRPPTRKQKEGLRLLKESKKKYNERQIKK